MERLYTPAEAGVLLHMSTEEVLELIGDGEICAKVVGKRNPSYLILESELERYVTPSSLTHSAMNVPNCLSNVKRLKDLGFNRDCPSCVYFLMSRGKVAYIGQSNNLHGRIGNHLTSKVFDRVLYFEVNPADAFDVEKKMIALHLPPLNNQISNTCSQDSMIEELCKMDVLREVR